LVGLVGLAAAFVARRAPAEKPEGGLPAAELAPKPKKNEGLARRPPPVEWITDINPRGKSGPAELVNVNGTLFFTAEDGKHGRGLWKSTPTPNGPVTALVKSIRPGHLTNFNGTLFFTVNDVARGLQLWKSAGTADSTVLVKTIKPGRNGALPPS